jgi:hypothetical protein
MTTLGDLLPTIPSTRAEWQELVQKLADGLAWLEREVMARIGWRDVPVVREVLDFAERVVRECKELVQEAAQVPFAILADLDTWLDVLEKAQTARDNTTLRAFDPDLEYVDVSAYRPWRGRYAAAYLSQIRPQNSAAAGVVDAADKATNSLARCLAAGFTKYGAWSLLAYQLVTWLVRALPSRGAVLIDGGDWVTLGRLYATAMGVSRGADQVVATETRRMRILVAARPGMTQSSRPRPGQFGVDRNWPNPFNDRSFIRAEVVRGRVFLDGGPPLAVNRTR